MSWLSSALGGIKNAVTDVGHFAGSVLSNPIADAVIGMTPLGPLGALGAGALGGLIKPGGNLGTTVTSGLTGGLSGLAGSGVKSLFDKITGIGQTGGAAGSDAGADGTTPTGSASQDQSILGKINDAIHGTGSWTDVLAAAGGDIKNVVNAMGGVQSLPAWAMAGIQAKNVADLGAKASSLADEALSTKKGDWESRAGLRSAGISGMLNPKTADLSGLLANSGPYATGLPRPGVQSTQQFLT